VPLSLVASHIECSLNGVALDLAAEGEWGAGFGAEEYVVRVDGTFERS
jgi:hypothetical protein